MGEFSGGKGQERDRKGVEVCTSLGSWVWMAKIDGRKCCGGGV